MGDSLVQVDLRRFQRKVAEAIDAAWRHQLDGSRWSWHTLVNRDEATGLPMSQRQHELADNNHERINRTTLSITVTQADYHRSTSSSRTPRSLPRSTSKRVIGEAYA